jgi:hypothetical protein
MAVLGDLLARAGFQRFPYTSFRVKNILNEYVYKLGETQRVCGPLPVNFREGVIQTVKWYRSSGKDRGDEDSGQLPLG